MGNDLLERLKKLVLRHNEEGYLNFYIVSLAIFYESWLGEGVSGGKTLEELATNLFWEFHNPRRLNNLVNAAEFIRVDMLVLDEAESEVVIEVLTEIEKDLRVPYKSDAEPPKDKLLIYLLVAVQLALLRKKPEGYSENVRDVLKECGRVIRWYEKYWPSGDYVEGEVTEADKFSFYAAGALAMIELFRICHIDGKYEEALDWFADAIQHTCIYHPDLKLTIDVDAMEPVNTFEQLKEADNAKNWNLVIDCCAIIFFHGNWSIDIEHFAYADSDGYAYYWSEFWGRALGWARAKLEPELQRKELRREEAEQAIKRINRYLLKKGMWDMLSQQAQERLIEADRTWFSGRETGGESIFNSIRITIAEILYEFFWVPLCHWLDSTPLNNLSILDFENLRAELTEKRKEPDLVHFESMLKSQAFKEYITTHNPSDQAKGFILKELPYRLERLRKFREGGEHERGRVWKRSEVEPIFKEFLGLGCKGVIPEVLEAIETINESTKK